MSVSVLSYRKYGYCKVLQLRRDVQFCEIFARASPLFAPLASLMLCRTDNALRLFSLMKIVAQTSLQDS
jgi:hypothetical protein